MNATVTILRDVTVAPATSEEPAAEANSFAAEIVSLQQPFMELAASQPVDAGVALRIDAPDAIWLGEAERCSAEGGGFAIRVRLRHVIRDFDTLTRLAERFGIQAPGRTTVKV